ncbi:MAG TPA: HAD family hydrolase [Rhodospirillaceae bacterium]|nr:HAD family hydrolase [Rhodospirillaceae bacterium]
MKSIPAPQAVIFDWDNTLIDNWGAITDALNKVRAMNGLETWTVPEARVKSARPLRVSFPEWFGDKWEAMRDIFYDRFYAVHIEQLVVMKGAPELLECLHNASIPMFIVSTKKNEILNKEVDHLGWRPFFKAIIGSMDCERDKPDRMPVDVALSSVGMKADDPAVWFVGDTHADVECSLRSGCTPVLVGDIASARGLGIRLHFFDCNTLKNWINNYTYT